MNFALVMLIALALDWVFGWPDWLFARIGHPVTWIGKIISIFETRLNAGSRMARLVAGGVFSIILIALVSIVALIGQMALPSSLAGAIVAGVLAWPLSAARSLQTHVQRVVDPLGQGDIKGARTAVSMIVGRDPAQLDAAAIARASTESLAENTSDGVVAPLFWGLLFGLPGIAAYKAINTLDSMIGHRSDRYEAFGKLAARLDDVANWVPARLTGLAFCLSRPARLSTAFQVMLRDAGKHRSPNAGWPEAALAGALNRRLSGPRVYGDAVSDEPWVHGTARDPDASDLRSALKLYRRVIVIFAGGLVVLAVLA